MFSFFKGLDKIQSIEFALQQTKNYALHLAVWGDFNSVEHTFRKTMQIAWSMDRPFSASTLTTMQNHFCPIMVRALG